MDGVTEVKSRLNIEDVVGEYVVLKRSGRNFKGLSPFSSEKTPSFIVSPEKQIWKDFSSGKGGSVFDFIMEVEGLDFKESLELLARKAGVELNQFNNVSPKQAELKKRLYEINEIAAKFYQVQFQSNKPSLTYVLKTRKFTKDTALKWRIGYSPVNGQALINFLKTRKFTENEIKQSGLSTTNYRGSLNDMFRGRLMMPLQDIEGRVIGFTARILEETPNAPKYINTSQTMLYDKSRHVYGLHLAKDSIRKNKYAVLAEGNLDVIASHQAGVTEAVATAGTALTLPQLKAIGRYSNNVKLCFDSDKAGVAATERAIPIASECNINLSIIELPDGKDPDELIRKDPKLWQEVISKDKYAVDWLIDHYKNTLDISSALGKKQFSDAVLPIVSLLRDPIEADHYLNLVAKTLNVSREAIGQKLITKTPKKSEKDLKEVKESEFVLDKKMIELIKIQDKFLCLMLLRPTLREYLNDYLKPEMFPTSNGKELYSYIKNNIKVNVKEVIKEKNLEDYVKIEVLLYEEMYQTLELNDLHDEAARLQADLVTKYVKSEKAKIAEAQRSDLNDKEQRELLEKDNQLNQLLNLIKRS